jgi:alkylation response protein AidB-like acyl-CoA dehydrogenase
LEEARIFPAHQVFRRLGDAGLLGITKPEAFGGLEQLREISKKTKRRSTAHRATIHFQENCRPQDDGRAGAPPKPFLR